jgi:hypothetical protein
MTEFMIRKPEEKDYTDAVNAVNDVYIEMGGARKAALFGETQTLKLQSEFNLHHVCGGMAIIAIRDFRDTDSLVSDARAYKRGMLSGLNVARNIYGTSLKIPSVLVGMRALIDVNVENNKMNDNPDDLVIDQLGRLGLDLASDSAIMRIGDWAEDVYPNTSRPNREYISGVGLALFTADHYHAAHIEESAAKHARKIVSDADWDAEYKSITDTDSL